MAVPKINTNYTQHGSLADQLVKQGYTQGGADEISQRYASSPYGAGNWDNFAKDNNIQTYSNELLPTEGLFRNPEYGSNYLGNNGQVMKSQLGNDQALNMQEFSKFAETHPEAAQQVGLAGVTFDANGQQIAQPTANNNTVLGLDNKQWNSVGQMGNVGLAAGQLGLGIMSYLDNKQTAEKQRKLLDQQYANNADLIAARQAKRDNIRKMFA